ncbi:MAG TPA: hypothetical protein VJJ01_00345 [Nitrosopumilaceae archaeon]|nr:hypothetical protein [Nitrosopumilaceae archaeon]
MNIKVLELIGFAFIGGMIYAMFGGEGGPIWPLFWTCAVGAVAINIYRRKKKKSSK